MDPHLSQISTLWTLVGQAHREEDPAVLADRSGGALVEPRPALRSQA